jgi:hypothetical protein
VIGGAVLTTLAPSAAPPAPSFDFQVLSIAAVIGAIFYAAYGLDFPASNRRFSRLR